MTLIYRLCALALITTPSILKMGCTPAVSPSPPGIKLSSMPISGKTSNSKDQKLFIYQVNQITEFTFGKFDPSTDEHWMTTIQRTNGTAAAKRRTDSAIWEFTSFPDGNSNQDRKANTTFIMHLLDSFQNLRKIADAPHGSLDSLGLDPPRYLIRLKTESNTLEVRIGDLSGDKQGHYVITDQNQPIIASSSALIMLSLISNFEYLRDHSWTTFSTDDVDEFILSHQGKPYFYAQREGDQWNDRRHNPLQLTQQAKVKYTPTGDSSRDAGTLLKDLAEVRPKAFLDDPAQVNQILKLATSQASPYEVQLIDRHGTQATLKVLKVAKNPGAPERGVKGPNFYGLSSTRPGMLFILDAKVITTFENAKLFSAKKL